jgi:hypothetical protein
MREGCAATRFRRVGENHHFFPECRAADPDGYRHVSTLAQGGVLAVVEHRARASASTPSWTGPRTSRRRISPDATASDHLRFFTIFLAGLLDDFGRYLARERFDLIADGVGYRQIPLEPTDQEFAELAGRLNAALAPVIANRPAPGRTRRTLTTIVMPTTTPAEGATP